MLSERVLVEHIIGRVALKQARISKRYWIRTKVERYVLDKQTREIRAEAPTLVLRESRVKPLWRLLITEFPSLRETEHLTEGLTRWDEHKETTRAATVIQRAWRRFRKYSYNIHTFTMWSSQFGATSQMFRAWMERMDGLIMKHPSIMNKWLQDAGKHLGMLFYWINDPSTTPWSTGMLIDGYLLPR